MSVTGTLNSYLRKKYGSGTVQGALNTARRQTGLTNSQIRAQALTEIAARQKTNPSRGLPDVEKIETEIARQERIYRRGGTTVVAQPKQRFEAAVDREGVKSFNEGLASQGVTNAREFVEGVRSGRININNKEGTITVNGNLPNSRADRGVTDFRTSPNLRFLEANRTNQAGLAQDQNQVKYFSQNSVEPAPRPSRNPVDALRRFSDKQAQLAESGNNPAGRRALSFATSAVSAPAQVIFKPGEVVRGTVAAVRNPKGALEATRESFRTNQYGFVGELAGSFATGRLLTTVTRPVTKVARNAARTASLRRFAPTRTVIVGESIRGRVFARAPVETFRLPTRSTVTRFVPVANEVVVSNRGRVARLVDTVEVRRQAPGFEVPRSRNIFETRTPERQLALRSGGEDPFVNRGNRIPLDDIVTPLQRAQRNPGQTRLQEFGINNPIPRATREYLRFRERQAPSSRLRETQYRIDEFGTRVTESGFIELNIPRPRFGGLGKRGQATLLFGRRSFRNLGDDYFTLRIPKAPFQSIPRTVRSVARNSRNRFTPLIYSSYTQRRVGAASSFTPLTLSAINSKNVSASSFSLQPYQSSLTRSLSRQSSLTVSSNRLSLISLSSFASAPTSFLSNNPLTSFSRRIPSRSTPRSKPILTFDRKEKRRNGFSLEVRNKGVFRNVGSFKELDRALVSGQDIAESSSAASFRVRDLRTGQLVDISRSLGGRFRSGKKDPFIAVERREFRISTGGELQQITLKGVRASRRNRL